MHVHIIDGTASITIEIASEEKQQHTIHFTLHQTHVM